MTKHALRSRQTRATPPDCGVRARAHHQYIERKEEWRRIFSSANPSPLLDTSASHLGFCVMMDCPFAAGCLLIWSAISAPCRVAPSGSGYCAEGLGYQNQSGRSFDFGYGSLLFAENRLSLSGNGLSFRGIALHFRGTTLPTPGFKLPHSGNCHCQPAIRHSELALGGWGLHLSDMVVAIWP